MVTKFQLIFISAHFYINPEVYRRMLTCLNLIVKKENFYLAKILWQAAPEGLPKTTQSMGCQQATREKAPKKQIPSSTGHFVPAQAP